jgi:hypothetical protein
MGMSELEPRERLAFDGVRARGTIGPIFEPLAEPQVILVSGRQYIALGNDLGTSIAVDPEDRSVVSIDTESGNRRLVSSSIAAFADSLIAISDFWSRHANDDDAAYKAAARMLRQQLADLDAPAVSSDETWWSTVVEQVEPGLL